MATYELYYWPMLQGRGEFVRLFFEDAGIDYVDVARRPEEEGGGIPAILAVMNDGLGATVPYAPPILKVDGEALLSQTANILQFLARREGRIADDALLQAQALQLQLTVSDLVAEAHDTHHPIGTGLYYEDQKDEARQATQRFIDDRIPKFLKHFELNLARHEGAMVGDEVTYVDLSVWQAVEGLQAAFPTAMRALMPNFPKLRIHHQTIGRRPRLQAYLQSERRLPFNEHGIFRPYPELDLARSS